MLILGVTNTDIAAEIRVLNTLIGAGVGVAFNLIYPPAMPARPAGRALIRVAEAAAAPLDAAGEALAAGPINREQVASWLDRSRTAARRVADANDSIALLRESRPFNPRALGTVDTEPVLTHRPGQPRALPAGDPQPVPGAALRTPGRRSAAGPVRGRVARRLRGGVARCRRLPARLRQPGRRRGRGPGGGDRAGTRREPGHPPRDQRHPDRTDHGRRPGRTPRPGCCAARSSPPSSRCWLSSTWRTAPGPTRPGRTSRPAGRWPSCRSLIEGVLPHPELPYPRGFRPGGVLRQLPLGLAMWPDPTEISRQKASKITQSEPTMPPEPVEDQQATSEPQPRPQGPQSPSSSSRTSPG